MRMVVRIHNYTAVGRTDAQPAGTARLTNGEVFIFQVAHLADGSAAVDVYFTYFAGRKTQQGVIPFFGHQLYYSAGAQLTTELVFFNYLKTTLSVGYGHLFAPEGFAGGRHGNEWMVSLKLL